MTKRFELLTAFHLKLAMVVLMVLDHIYQLIPGMPYWFHQTSRLVMPVFAFLAAEGLRYTRNREKYASRLLWFGTATLAGNMFLAMIHGTVITNCILITYALSVQCVAMLDKYLGGDKKKAWLAMAFLLAAACYLFEGSLLVPAAVLIFYYLRDKPALMYVAYIAVSLALLWLLRIGDPAQWLMIFAAIPLCLYNGKRGTQGVSGFFLKYAFYIFYPLHIWIIYLVAHIGGFR